MVEKIDMFVTKEGRICNTKEEAEIKEKEEFAFNFGRELKEALKAVEPKSNLNNIFSKIYYNPDIVINLFKKYKLL